MGKLIARLQSGGVAYADKIENQDVVVATFESTDVKELTGNPYFEAFDYHDLYDRWDFNDNRKHKPKQPERLKWVPGIDEVGMTNRALALMNRSKLRDRFVHEYAWAVPTDEAISALKSLLPIYEIGAGSGYWARMITGKWESADYYAYDNFESHAFTHFYHKVYSDPLDAWDGTLFLCWPSYSSPFAADALKQLKPISLVYVGENGGCTANDEFHELLDSQYEEVQSIELPQYDGIHDWLWIYRRNS